MSINGCICPFRLNDPWPNDLWLNDRWLNDRWLNHFRQIRRQTLRLTPLGQRPTPLVWYGQQIYGEQMFGSGLPDATWRWLQHPTATLLTRSHKCLRAEAAVRAAASHELKIKSTLNAEGAIASDQAAKAPAAQLAAERTGDLPRLSERRHGAARRNLIRSHPGVEKPSDATAAAAPPQLPLRGRHRPHRHRPHGHRPHRYRLNWYYPSRDYPRRYRVGG